MSAFVFFLSIGLIDTARWANTLRTPHSVHSRLGTTVLKQKFTFCFQPLIKKKICSDPLSDWDGNTFNMCGYTYYHEYLFPDSQYGYVFLQQFLLSSDGTNNILHIYELYILFTVILFNHDAVIETLNSPIGTTVDFKIMVIVYNANNLTYFYAKEY